MELKDKKLTQAPISYAKLIERGVERMTKLRQTLAETKQYGWSSEITHAVDDLDRILDKQLRLSKEAASK